MPSFSKLLLANLPIIFRSTLVIVVPGSQITFSRLKFQSEAPTVKPQVVALGRVLSTSYVFVEVKFTTTTLYSFQKHEKIFKTCYC